MNIFRQIVSILLILISIVPFGYKDFILINYAIHQDEIIEEFCENKDKPELECNGKCHISKELNYFNNTENLNTVTSESVSIDNSWLLSVQFIHEIASLQSSESRFLIGFNQAIYHFNFPKKVFQPPKV